MDEKQWTVFSHLGTLIGLATSGLFNFLVPLVIWLSKKDESQLIAAHAKESLNFQLSILLYEIVAAVLIFTIILIPVAIPALIALGILNIVLVIIAALKADKGEFYHYPLTIKFVE